MSGIVWGTLTLRLCMRVLYEENYYLPTVFSSTQVLEWLDQSVYSSILLSRKITCFTTILMYKYTCKGIRIKQGTSLPNN